MRKQVPNPESQRNPNPQIPTGRGLLLLPLLCALPGCVGLVFEREKDGTPRPVIEAKRLEPGRSSLREVLGRLGPPDLLLRAGEVDRAYYFSWDSDYFKLVVSIALPFTARNLSLDVFTLAVGSEELRLARLEFDRAGTLRDVQCVDFTSSSGGESVGVDNRVVERFLEDRSRALGLRDGDDDDEDVELDGPRRRPPK